MLASVAHIEEALRLLTELRSLLEKEGDVNWRRGIEAAIHQLSNEDGTLNAAGLENARSIFKTMTAGGRGFAEYYIWKNDEDARIAANKRLDDLRAKTWAMLGE